MSRIFQIFPANSTCPICRTNENKACVLIPVDGTLEGKNEQALPTHVECLTTAKFRYHKEEGIPPLLYLRV